MTQLAQMVHIPLNGAYLCASCNHVINSPYICPYCSATGTYLMSLSKVLNREETKKNG